MNAVIYSKPNCRHCDRAKALFESNNVKYQEMIVSPGFNEDDLKPHQQYVTLEQLLEQAPNAKTVPQIWLNNSYIGGYTELESFFKKP